MTDLPILMSPPMVRAWLAGDKTMTRRLAWRKGPAWSSSTPFVMAATNWQRVEPGDRLWIRERWCVGKRHDFLPPTSLPYVDGLTTMYEAGGSRGREETPSGRLEYRNDFTYPPNLPDWAGRMRAAMHLPRLASRLTLIVQAVKIEPLQAITEADAKAEGARPATAGVDGNGEPVTSFRTGFVRLWGEIHGTESWLGNPDVVALTCQLVRSNIDDIPATASPAARQPAHAP